MGPNDRGGAGKWMALTAALLGWMFDGMEMGLFPQVAGPALKDLLSSGGSEPGPGVVPRWLAVITASFLVGAATGGVLFGWLGDRVGRVRAMTLSVLTYAIFSGLCGLATSAWQVAGLRFVAALGMGGEWSLGVALVMEVWPNSSRGLLAGLIGLAANFGYMLVSVVGLGLRQIRGQLEAGFLAMGMGDQTVAWLTGNDGWRILLLFGAAPALLTFFIRLLVPESARWEQERQRGATTHWATRDLVGVLVGAVAGLGLISLWAIDGLSVPVRLIGSVVALTVVTGGYLYPTLRYLRRAESDNPDAGTLRSPTVRRMLLAACLSGVPLLATWGSVQQAPLWANELANPDKLDVHPMPQAKYYTQFWSAFGACVGTMFGALLGFWIGRRVAYVLLCVGSMVATLLFFNLNTVVDARFLAMVCLVGALSASFYGWLPLYLPELFRTNVRATGQGFGFNFGRVLAAVGVLQLENLVLFFGSKHQAFSALCCIYVVGVAIIWLAPETRGKPLPE